MAAIVIKREDELLCLSSDHGHPGSVVHSILPVCNCFVFFEVCPQSFHQVRNYVFY